MEIRFAGLIAHVTLDPGTATERQLAALVAAANHKATLSVRKAAVINDGGIGNTIGNTTCFPLKGRVGWPALGGGPASRVIVAGEVPSLRHVTNGMALSAELTSASPSSTVFHAVLDLPPGGRLAPDDFFKHEVDFNGVPFGGLTRIVRYLIATTGTIIIDIDGTKIELDQDPELLVANVCPITTGNHFQNYKLVFDPPATTVFDPDDSAKRPCPWGTPEKPLPKCAQGSNLQVDCSNSAFP